MFKRFVFILAVVSAIGTASLETRERWTDERDAQFGFLGAQEDTLNLRPAKIEADPQSALTRVAGHARLSWLSK